MTVSSDQGRKRKKKKSAIPVRESAWLEMRNRTMQKKRRKRKGRAEKAKRQMFEENQPERLISNRRSSQKEKTSPQKVVFNNCIVFKVQEFMYKNTVVLASAPQRKEETNKTKKRTEERHKFWGREREKESKNTERTE